MLTAVALAFIMVVAAEGYCYNFTLISPKPSLTAVTPIKPIIILTATPTPTPTVNPDRVPSVLTVDPNPATLNAQLKLSGTGVANHIVVLFVSGTNMNKKFTINSDGHYSGTVNVSPEIGITGPGSYTLYLMDTRTEVKSNSVTLSVVTITPTTGALLTPTPTELATSIPKNYTNVNAASVTPTAAPSPTPEATPADNNTTAVHYAQTTNKTIPALPMDMTAATVLVTAGALMAMERSRKK